MNENDYWEQLEYRLCRELAHIAEAKQLGLWCDGFIISKYHFERGQITGTVWIGRGPRDQENWPFEVFFAPAAKREEIPWCDLIPAEETRGWLRIDLDRKTMTIDLRNLAE